MVQMVIVQDLIREFVLKTFPLARKKDIVPTEKWLASGLIDSLGILDLVHFLEDSFTIHVSDEELTPENFESLGAVSEFAQRKIAERQTPEGQRCS